MIVGLQSDTPAISPTGGWRFYCSRAAPIGDTKVIREDDVGSQTGAG